MQIYQGIRGRAKVLEIKFSMGHIGGILGGRVVKGVGDLGTIGL